MMSRAIYRFSLQITAVMRVSNRLPKKFVFENRKCFHLLNQNFNKKKDNLTLPAISFDQVEDKSKDVFLEVLHRYKVKEKHRKGHVEFIYGAMKYMKEFGVEKDLEVYRALIDCMPKGKYVPQNVLQAEFMHFPKQQQCIVDLLDQMEYNRVIPDPELGEMLINIFGERGHPVRKFMRMLYWMPKFKNISPWSLPDSIPKDPFELAMLAIKRITSIDPTTKISVYSTRTVEDAVDDTWVISAQSKDQQDLLVKHDSNKPVYVEGAFRVWLRDACVYYFVLLGKPEPGKEKAKDKVEVDLDDVTKIKPSFFAPPVSEVAVVPSIHEQEDGTYYAVCATGSSSRDSLLSWIRLLQRENPRLLEVPVLFTLRSPTSEVVKRNTDINEKNTRSGDKDDEGTR